MSFRPSRLEYAHAFDQAASWLGGFGEPFLAVVSTCEFVDQVLARAEGGVCFVCDDRAVRDHASHRLESGTVPIAVATRSQVFAGIEQVPNRFGAAVWAAPQPATCHAMLDGIGELLEPAARLCLLVGSPWGGLLRPVRRGWGPGQPAPLAAELRARIADAGWRVERAAQFGGLPSVGWAVAGLAAGVAARDDLADRAESAHHRAILAEFGASFELLQVRREGMP